MQRGEHAQFLVKSPYTKTDTETKKFNFPTQADVTMIIHLIDFENAKDIFNSTRPTYEEKFAASLQRKEAGNRFFRDDKFVLASRKYNRALEIALSDTLSTDSQRDKLKKEIELPCYNNLAQCEIKRKRYNEAIVTTTKVLEIDPLNCKGLWRRGIAYTETGNWIEAEKDLKRAQELASQTEKKTVSQSYTNLKKLMAEQDKKDKEKYRKIFDGTDPTKFYADLLKEIESIITTEQDLFANAANVASVLHEQLNKIKQNKVNWTGFYWLHHDGQLVLGSFQGKMACTRIQRGKGVCGTAVEKKKTQLVADVHNFDGHIACDSDSSSEIVIPIIVNGVVLGVLDIDSVVIEGFDNRDQVGLEKIVHLMQNTCRWEQLRRVTRPLANKARQAGTQLHKFLFGIGLTVFLGVAAGIYFKMANSTPHTTSGSSPAVKSIMGL